MRRWVMPVVALLAVGATGVGLGWSLNGWGEGSHRLTAPEAAEFAQNFLSDIGGPGLFTCKGEDFNERDDAWIVVCAHSSGVTTTLRVFDDDGRVEAVQ